MNKEEKKQWALQQYQAGDKVRSICEAIGITTPTLYRWLRLEIEPRRPDMWNANSEPSLARSEASKKAWQARFAADPVQSTLKRSKNLSLMDILARFSLSLSLDHLGHAMVHADRPGRLYLTDTEFKALSRDPVPTLKALSGRINSTFGGENG